MLYDIVCKDNNLVIAKKSDHEWTPTEKEDFDIVEDVEMEPSVEDYQVEVFPDIWFWASDIDSDLIVGEM